MDNNRHITEQELDYCVGNPDALTADEKAAIQAHINVCKLCSERLSSVQNFYGELHERLEQHPSAYDKKLAEELLRPKTRGLLSSDALARTYAESVQFIGRRWPGRFIQYARAYPLRTFSGAVTLAALLVVGYVTMKPSTDSNPAYATIKDQVLHVFNKTHDLLWTKDAKGLRDFPELPESQQRYRPSGLYYYFKSDDDQAQPVRVFDIDGDGINEVFVAMGSTSTHSPSFSSNWLYCFNRDGTVRWTYAPEGRGLKFGNVDFSEPTDWYIHRFLPIQRTPSEKIQLFVISQHRPSWPSRIAELNPLTGEELQAYWHTGAIGLAVVTDVDGNGVNDLVFGGINNGFNQACLLVFDPAVVTGVGPTSTELTPQGLPRGSEKYYLLLPRTDIIPSDVPYNIIQQLDASERGGITVHTNEGTHAAWKYLEELGGIVYSFDEQMSVRYVVASSPFEKSLERAEREGLIKDFKLDEAFYNRLKDGIRYWEGERFVREPTMNRLYTSMKNPP